MDETPKTLELEQAAHFSVVGCLGLTLTLTLTLNEDERQVL